MMKFVKTLAFSVVCGLVAAEAIAVNPENNKPDENTTAEYSADGVEIKESDLKQSPTLHREGCQKALDDAGNGLKPSPENVGDCASVVADLVGDNNTVEVGNIENPS